MCLTAATRSQRSAAPALTRTNLSKSVRADHPAVPATEAAAAGRLSERSAAAAAQRTAAGGHTRRFNTAIHCCCCVLSQAISGCRTPSLRWAV